VYKPARGYRNVDNERNGCGKKELGLYIPERVERAVRRRRKERTREVGPSGSDSVTTSKGEGARWKIRSKKQKTCKSKEDVKEKQEGRADNPDEKREHWRSEVKERV